MNDNDIKTFKKIELLNILFYSFSNLFKPSPHSTIKLSYNKKLISDFYYNSNCEIPCNKYDNSLYFLFSTLDFDIIIKAIFLLLTNKSLELISSNAINLSIIIPALLKLIYPIKLDYLIIPVIPLNNIEDYINYKQKHLFGLLNINNSLNKIITNEKGCTIIDIDYNIIYRYKHFVPYCPIPTSDLFKADKLNLYINEGKLMKFNIDKKNFENIKILDNGKIFIDNEKESLLVLEHNDGYLNEKEYNFLKREVNKKLFNFFFQDFQINFDYEINLLFTKTIFSKLMNNKDSLSMDMRIQNNYIRIKKEFQFDNDSPNNIMKNLDLYNIELNYQNSYFIKQEIFDFPFEESKDFLSKIENLEETKKIYKKIKECLNDGIIKMKYIKKQNNQNLKFYGENGFINFFKKIKEIIKDKEEDFYIKCYNKKIYDEIDDFIQNYLTKDLKIDYSKLKLKSNKYSIEISNMDNEELNYPNLYLYLSNILENMKESNLFSNKYDLDSFNKKIINFYNSAYNINFPNFPFFIFYKYLEKLTDQEKKNINVKLCKTLQKLIKTKTQKNE
jgi:hypothetical protein